MESETNIKSNEVGTPSEPSKRRRKIVAAILVVLIVFAVCCYFCCVRSVDSSVDYDYEAYLAPKPGTMVTVQFRRDALGAASNLPISPTTGSINGARVSIQGNLVAVNQEAVLLLSMEGHSRRIIDGIPQPRLLWIPKSSILMIDYHEGPETR